MKVIHVNVWFSKNLNKKKDSILRTQSIQLICNSRTILTNPSLRRTILNSKEILSDERQSNHYILNF